MSEQVLEIEDHGAVRVLRITRPHAVNAINGQVLFEMIDAVKAIDRSRDVRCFVITGGPRADGRPCFSAGDDLKEAAAGGHPPGNPGFTLTNLIDDSLVPSIAVVDGICTPGALEIAMACDLRVVADTARMSDWHLARLGTGLGGWGASTRLPRLVGVAQAKDIILTGKEIDGVEAHRIGLAQRVVPSSELWERAIEVAQAIAGMDPNGVRMTMAHLAQVEDLSKAESLAFAKQVRRWFSERRSFPDAAAGVLDRFTGRGAAGADA